MSQPTKTVQCEGWHRTGIFQMGGTGRWKQCKSDAIVNLKFKDNQDGGNGKVKILPARKECWDESVEHGINIIEARPIKPTPTAATERGGK